MPLDSWQMLTTRDDRKQDAYIGRKRPSGPKLTAHPHWALFRIIQAPEDIPFPSVSMGERSHRFATL